VPRALKSAQLKPRPEQQPRQRAWRCFFASFDTLEASKGKAVLLKTVAARRWRTFTSVSYPYTWTSSSRAILEPWIATNPVQTDNRAQGVQAMQPWPEE
jgi:hypothetical protein